MYVSNVFNEKTKLLISRFSKRFEQYQDVKYCNRSDKDL